MAECVRYICRYCGKTIEAWSDGNPYFINERGQKEYAYHPDHEKLARCTGNDRPHLCLACGEEFTVDSRLPDATCPVCKSRDTSETSELDGRDCPACKAGFFTVDPEFFAVS